MSRSCRSLTLPPLPLLALDPPSTAVLHPTDHPSVHHYPFSALPWSAPPSKLPVDHCFSQFTDLCNRKQNSRRRMGWMHAKYSGIASRKWQAPRHRGAAAPYHYGSGGTAAPPPLASCTAQCRPGTLKPAGEAAANLKVGLFRAARWPPAATPALPPRPPAAGTARPTPAQIERGIRSKEALAEPWMVCWFDWQAAAAGCGDSASHTCSSEQQRQASRCDDQHTDL